MDFLGASEAVTGDYNRTAPDGGRMELQLTQYASSQGRPGWFFADVHWPVLSA